MLSYIIQQRTYNSHPRLRPRYYVDNIQYIDRLRPNNCGHLKERPIASTHNGGYCLDCKRFICNDCAKVIFYNQLDKETNCCIGVCKECIHLYKYHNTEYKCVEKDCKNCEENRPNIFVRFVENVNNKLTSIINKKDSRINNYYRILN